MNVRDFSLLIKNEYIQRNGARFFTERALRSALLEQNGFHRDAPLLTPNMDVDPVTEKKLRSDLARLLNGYPIQYYLGSEWFCGLEFLTAPNVLIPRPETEGLVEKAACLAEQGSVVFDFCCGSGCIGLSLLQKRNDLRCRMYDLSESALELSRKNRDRFGLAERCCVERLDVLSHQALSEVEKHRPALILSNPPYLTAEEMGSIAENVQNEPSMALFGGEDGLDFYRALVALAAQTGVALLCEIGCNQKKVIESLLNLHHFEYEFYQDFAGLDRVFYARTVK